MFDGSPHGAGRYTTFFTRVSAGDVSVPGLPPGSAGSSIDASPILSTAPGSFKIGPDITTLLAPPTAYLYAAD